MAIVQGVKTVTTAGTAVVLTTGDTLASWVMLQAQKIGGSANAGDIYLGDSNVGNAGSGNYGLKLSPGDVVTLQELNAQNGYNLDHIYINSDVNGDGVTFIYGQL